MNDLHNFFSAQVENPAVPETVHVYRNQRRRIRQLNVLLRCGKSNKNIAQNFIFPSDMLHIVMFYEITFYISLLFIFIKLVLQ